MKKKVKRKNYPGKKTTIKQRKFTTTIEPKELERLRKELAAI